MLPRFVVHWIITVIAVYVAVLIVPGLHYTDWVGLGIFALILGVVNAVVKPILKLLTLPLILMTFGLLILVINALLFWLASAVSPGFTVDGFTAALLGSLVVTIVSWALGLILDQDNRRQR